MPMIEVPWASNEGQQRILDAVRYLQSKGHEVGMTGDIPGLWHVDGREVTTGQLLDIALNS